jgi:type I restriction enzyme S subunit
LRGGDLMIVITGATVGRCAVFPHTSEPGFVNQHVAICRLPCSEIDPYFALYGLRSPLGQAQLLGQRYGQGKPGLNLTNIRAITLPIPSSIEEQRRIVAYLDDLQARVDALQALQAATAAELDALLPAVLDKAFRGEL